jgi:hypothetical protein
MYDAQAVEERVYARVLEKIEAKAPQGKAESVASDSMETDEAARAAGVEAQPSAAGPEPITSWSLPAGLELSLIGEIWWDIRTLLRMVRDPLYSMTWLGVLVPLFALVYITFPWKIWPLNAIPDSFYLIGLLDDLAVAYLGFKVLGRELRRYRTFLARRVR